MQEVSLSDEELSNFIKISCGILGYREPTNFHELFIWMANRSEFEEFLVEANCPIVPYKVIKNDKPVEVVIPECMYYRGVNGAYNIILGVHNDPICLAGCILHEITHFIQEMNGVDYDKEIIRCEKEAIRVEEAWYTYYNYSWEKWDVQ